MSSKGFFICGSVKLFSELEFESFLIGLPRDCYPNYVQEFYGNLTTDRFKNYVSFMKDKKSTLNVPFMNSISRIESESNVFVFTKKGPVVFNGFSELDQLRVCRSIPGILKFHCPTT